MQLQHILVAGGFLCLAMANCDVNHDWRPPKKDDSRSPCPGLNVLANHGWLPRSGKEIDLTAIRSAVSGGFNYEYYMFDTAVQMVWDFHLSTTKTPNRTFNLEDLKVHDKIEFDGSLSRNDFYSGDDLHFDPKIWATMAHRLNLYHDEKEKHVTIESAAKARAARVKDAMAANPTFNASALQQIGSYGTTALYLSTVWNHEVNAAFKKDVKAFFEEERMSFKRSKVQKTQEFLGNMTQAVIAVKV